MSEELKTLEDFAVYEAQTHSCLLETICIEDLKTEAIKWVKDISGTYDKAKPAELSLEQWKREVGAANEWIKLFFNLTEADLNGKN